MVNKIKNTKTINTLSRRTINNAKKRGNKRTIKCNYRQGTPQAIQLFLRGELNKQVRQSGKTNLKVFRGKELNMVNERKTEKIVREHFEKDIYYKKGKVVIEEQKSDNPRIDKLLKRASKKGNGAGFPEFIISFVEEPNLIIVIECKADIKKHQSETKREYSKYAVDGALLYSSYLSKDFDVISIGVSGETKKDLNISHFLQMKNNISSKDFLGDKLLSFENYIDSYMNSELKFNQDYSDLMIYSKELNTQLHKLKIKESSRSLLISGILLALKSTPFKFSYEKYTIPEEISKYLVDTISNELGKGNIQQIKVDGLKNSYSFIHDHEAFSKDANVLKNIIRDIDKNINQFMKTYKYYDVLGQFYIEFLRYANSDKGLGIVLTPPHITELFSDIAGVNKDSIVFDNCCGTGGFLISAMKKMIKDAKGNNVKIKKIKNKQIAGIEYQTDIFALACSNMFIHGDGNSGAFKGDCFDRKLMQTIKSKYKPTIGFLNPPYKTDKKNDIEEFEYVLNNLEMLEPNGTCVAIVPMSCVIANSGKIYELKKKLLKFHTLEAVFSMPNDLFVNSKVGTVTAVVVFKAHQKHPSDKETFFGYWKDDGFIKNRSLGRCDYFNRWDNIKKEWLYTFRNKKNTKDSLNRLVSAKDEWCIEAYMKTNYQTLNEDCFIEILKEYSGYLFLNGLSDDVSKRPFSNNKKINLNINKWKDFLIDDSFKVFSGGDKPKISDKKNKDGVIVNSIENLTTNNGVNEKISFSGDKKFKNFISVVSIGAGGHAFYQSELGAIFTRVKALVPKNEFHFSKYIGLFLVAILRLEKAKYSYGRVLDKDRLKYTKIKLPTDKNGNPDWIFMENFIKSLEYSSNL